MCMVCACVCANNLHISGDEYKWDEASEAVLWSLVKKYKKELYDQKNRFTRNEYLDKIARKLCEYWCDHLWMATFAEPEDRHEFSYVHFFRSSYPEKSHYTQTSGQQNLMH